MSEFLGPSPSDIGGNISPDIPPRQSENKTPQELTNDRIQRLEELAKDFDDEKTSSALRVYDFLQHENDFPTRKPWSKFKTIDDFKLYHQLNPEWQGLNKKEIDKLDGGIAFRGALERWADKQNKNLTKEEKAVAKNNLIREILPTTVNDWSQLNTIEQWQEYFNQHPEWKGLSTSKIDKDKEGSKFYNAFSIWTHKEVQNINENKESIRKNLVEKIFPPKIIEKDWSKFETIEQWQEYFDQHPEWKGLSTSEIDKDKEGSKFYNAFSKWKNKIIKDLPTDEQPSAKKNLVEKIFPPKNDDWSKFTTIEKWQEYFDQHPEWKGLSTTDIQANKEGVRKSYDGLNYWISKQTKEVQEQANKILNEKIFPRKLKDWSKFVTLEQWQEYFNQHPEWKGLSTTKILKTEGSSFYYSFKEWIDKQVENLQEKEQKTTKKTLIESVFPPKNKDQPLIKDKNETNKSEIPIISQQEIPKLESQPEIIIPISSGKSISFDDKEDIKFSDGFTLGNVETTSIKTNGNGNGTNNIRYSISVDNLTDSQRLRFLTGREDQNPELYAKNIGQLATYVVHRGEIGFLLNLFSQNNLNFPKVIADLGAGPSTAYSAYEQLAPTIQEYGFSKPQIIDVEKNSEMRNFGKNPNKIESDITKEILLENQSVDMVQSTFVINHFKSSEIYQTLSEANRITKNGGYLSLICSRPFSQSFLDGVENLGYQVITEHGAVLTPNNQMVDALSQEFDTETAKRFQNRFNSSFILFAKKNTDISEINQLPSPETFTFDQAKKNHRGIKDILDLKNYNIDSSPLTENIERITDSIVYQLQQLEVSPLRQEGGLIPGGNEIKSSYETFNGNLNLIKSLYDKIYNKIKNQFNTLTPEQIDQFDQLKEQLRTTEEYKKDFYQRHIR